MKIAQTFIAFLLGCCMALSVQAQNQRDYHEAVYDSGCRTCLDQGLKHFPSDESCLQCHDMAVLAQ